MRKPRYDPSILIGSDQCVALSWVAEGTTIFIAVIYASIYHVKRRSLWIELTDLMLTYNGPGYFSGTLMLYWDLMNYIWPFLGDLMLTYNEP
jgi:hypothetical protein